LSDAHITRVPQINRFSFHGIMPGSTNYPLGQIALDVCFGNRQNYSDKGCPDLLSERGVDGDDGDEDTRVSQRTLRLISAASATNLNPLDIRNVTRLRT
jgi:hypothetical protein